MQNTTNASFQNNLQRITTKMTFQILAQELRNIQSYMNATFTKYQKRMSTNIIFKINAQKYIIQKVV